MALKDLLNVASLDAPDNFAALMKSIQENPEPPDLARKLKLPPRPTLSPTNEERHRAEEFIKRHVEGKSPLRGTWIHRGKPALPYENVWQLSVMLGAACSSYAKKDEELISRLLLDIFNESVGGDECPTALRVNILAGRFEIEPRDLLDAIARELLVQRRSIRRCSYCSKFFLKANPQDKYCPTGNCAYESRLKDDRIRKQKKRKSKGRNKR
jgi:hypothetical protein